MPWVPAPHARFSVVAASRATPGKSLRRPSRQSANSSAEIARNIHITIDISIVYNHVCIL